jgi:hypothetical protein
MTTPAGPPGPAGPLPGRTGWPEARMRVSDAERAMVADRLARHFSDGRLDRAEFDDRLDRALQAKTRADLIGLLSDLPEGLPAADDDPERARSRRRRDRQLRRQSPGRLPAIVTLVVIVLVVATVLRHVNSLWPALAVVAFLWLRHGRRG